MATPDHTKPDLLQGIRVLDWSQFYAAPGAGALLGDMGAEVILIEQPGGDPTRQMTRVGGTDFSLPRDRNVLFEAVGRNKKSIVVDITREKGREVIERLVARSDVLHTNFRRPTLAKLQMEYETLSRINPRLIYSRVSGFGPRGPLRDQGGFDFIVQGFSGMMKAMGDETSDLAPPLTLIIDQATSMMAASAVVAALFHRERTGRGQELHTSLLGTTVSLLYFHYLSVFLSGQEVKKHSRTSPGNLLRNYYRCADGKWIICAHNPPERYWERFCRAVGLDNLVTHPAAAEGGSRKAHPDELVAVLDRQFATKPQAEWLRIAEQHDLFFAPVNTVPEAASEPQVLENFVERVAHRDLGEVPYPGFCTEFGDAEVRPRGAAPRLGEHTDEILREAAGYTDREVETLRAEGVVGTKETGQ